MALHDAGGYSGNVGRPLGGVFVPPSYGITFFNKMLDTPLSAVGLTSETPNLYEYEEELGSTNLKYSRVLHFSVTDGGTGKKIQDDLYVPYIDSVAASGFTSIFTTKPLVEVINPRFTQVAPNIFIMYFFSNFTTKNLPDDGVYTDDPKYLRRMVEFSTNAPNALDGKSPSGLSAPLPNNRNYYTDGAPVDSKPKIAFMSALLRVFPASVEVSSSSASSSVEKKVYIIAEKPFIITWVGYRFSLDNNPPLLVNKTQSVEWSLNKSTSNSLDDDAVNDSPPRQIPYHHLISRINTVMYGGYAGINFYTRPIHDIYDQVLNHGFRRYVGTYPYELINRSWYYLGYPFYRKLKSIGFVQEDNEGLYPAGSYGPGTQEHYTPFQKHYAIIELNGPDFRSFSSSSSSWFPSYNVFIPAIDMWGSDKPEFWRYYWQVCGSGSSTSSIGYTVLGTIPQCDSSCNFALYFPFQIGTGTQNFQIWENNQWTNMQLTFGINYIGSTSVSYIQTNHGNARGGGANGFSPGVLTGRYAWNGTDQGPWSCSVVSGDATGGSITVDYQGDGYWYGTGCINGVEMYAKIEKRPYGYYGNEGFRYWVTYGLLTTQDIELDIVWQGFKVNDIYVQGIYERHYALGDDTEETLEVSSVL